MISVCIITKNESENIRECLNRIEPYGFEIIVVDTGSTDDTKEMALRYTDKVFDFEWCDDFSAARNFSVSKATNDYILVIDSDEFITALDTDSLYRMIEENPECVGRIERTNSYWRGNEQVRVSERINRIFNKNRFYYKGRIHEQIVAFDRNEYFTYNAPLTIDHVGYDGELEFRKKKTQRNIELLEKDLAENREDPYILYQLGKSYYMQQDYEKSCAYFSKALETDLNPKLEYVIDMVETYGYALVNAGKPKDELLLENIYNELGKKAEFQGNID